MTYSTTCAPAALAVEWEQPLPFSRLTHLQLHDRRYTSAQVLTMTSEMRALEVVEVWGRNGWVCIRRKQQPGVDRYAELRRELLAQLHE